MTIDVLTDSLHQKHRPIYWRKLFLGQRELLLLLLPPRTLLLIVKYGTDVLCQRLLVFQVFLVLRSRKCWQFRGSSWRGETVSLVSLPYSPQECFENCPDWRESVIGTGCSPKRSPGTHGHVKEPPALEKHLPTTSYFLQDNATRE